MKRAVERQSKGVILQSTGFLRLQWRLLLFQLDLMLRLLMMMTSKLLRHV
jgi:hypothetical protein